MPLKIRHVEAEEAPSPTSTGKANKDQYAVKNEMLKIGKRMALEIEREAKRPSVERRF